jgi:hypothetical protein
MAVDKSSRGAASADGVRSMSGADVLVTGPERPRGGWTARRAYALALPVTLFGVGAAGVIGAASPEVPGPGDRPAPRVSIAVDVGDVGPRTVLGLADLCLDARHVTLVANALRHERSVGFAQASGWCD